MILHRFTSGDALTNYTMREAYQGYETNEYIGKWQQLMYSFSFSERSNDFDEYYLEVQNNAIHHMVRTTPSMVCVFIAPYRKLT